MIQRLLDANLPNVRGVHFCTLNLEKSVRTIMENLGWVQQPGSLEGEAGHGNKLIDQNGTMAPLTGSGSGDHGTLGTSPSKQLMGLSISPQEAATMAELGFKHRQAHHTGHADNKTETTAGAGEKTKGPHQPAPPGGAVGVVEDWDEYPNGRFTDVRSPAYGEIDGYGNGLKVTVSTLVSSARDFALIVDTTLTT